MSGQIIEYRSGADFQEAHKTIHDGWPALLIPATQAMISGIFLGLAAGVLWRDIWAFVIAWALVQAGCWLILLGRWLGAVGRVERLLGIDLNNDGYIGDPEPYEPEPVRIELIQDSGRRCQFVDLPVSENQLIQLATGIQSGASFSEGQFTGSGAPFSRSEFRSLRDIFLRRDWLAWRNERSKNQGLEFTRAGSAVMRYYASLANTPQLIERNPETKNPAVINQGEILSYHPITSPIDGDDNVRM